MDTLIIDVTEQRITRPSNEEIQPDYYSGKRGGTTLRRKSHDDAILKSLFKPIENG